MTQSLLKKAIQQAVIEVVREQRYLFAEALVEAMEDVAPISAIRKGRKSKPVARNQAMRSLAGTPTVTTQPFAYTGALRSSSVLK